MSGDPYADYSDMFDEEIDEPNGDAEAKTGAANSGDAASDGGANVNGDAPPDIPADTMDVICNDVADDRLRAIAFWNIILVLKRRGLTVDDIVALLEKSPDGIAKKYRGRLRYEVGRVYGKINQGQQDDDDGAPPG